MRHDSITVRTDGLVSGSIYNQLRSPTLQALLVADKSAAHAAKPHPCPNSLACAKDYYAQTLWYGYLCQWHNDLSCMDSSAACTSHIQGLTD